LTAFETMQRHYQQRDMAAREWKNKGGNVVGYFCDSVPEELILAAGFFPLRLTGDPHSGTEEIDKYLETFYEGFVRTSLNMILTGKYDFVDYLVIPRARDSVAQLYSHLCQIKSLNPAIKLPILYFLPQVQPRSYMSGFFNHDRMLEFKNQLEKWAGKKITKKALSKAIVITNENKKLLKQVASLRAAERPYISGVEALQIIGSSMFMLKEEHNKLLSQFLAEAEKLPTRDGVTLFVEGSPMDNLQFYQVVESCGATVVAEDNCWGNRYSDTPINTTIDPLEAIVSRYQNKSPCPYVFFPAGLRAEYCQNKAVESKARGVVFYISEWDPAQIWDYPEQKKALEAKGVPTVCFMHQKYLISDVKPLETGIEKFVGSIGT
jgi:benzoyl-CoA reductase/2-hydroxyglutaryl-CoA dehydratase subunit BcrC/BadD/HgdB